MDSNKIIEKAAMSVSDLTGGSNAGYLNIEQSDKFIRGIIDQPTIIKQARSVLIKGESKKIEKIGFGQRIMRPGVENTALTEDQYAKPTTSKVELHTKEVIAETRISYDTLEANIEGANLKNTIISMIQERCSLDLEELIVQGNTESADPYLAILDGVLKKASQHVVDANGRVPNLYDFTNLVKSVPVKYIRNAAQWGIYTSRNVDLAWKNVIAQRNTAAGDKYLLGDSPVSAAGYNLKPIAMMPESASVTAINVTSAAAASNTVKNVVVTGTLSDVPKAYVGRTATFGGETRKIVDYTVVGAVKTLVLEYPLSAVPDSAAGTIDAVANLGTGLLTHPQNIIVGFTRQVQMEMDKDISRRQIIIVTTLKVDTAIEEADAVGKLININPSYTLF